MWPGARKNQKFILKYFTAWHLECEPGSGSAHPILGPAPSPQKWRSSVLPGTVGHVVQGHLVKLLNPSEYCS